MDVENIVIQQQEIPKCTTYTMTNRGRDQMLLRNLSSICAHEYHGFHRVFLESQKLKMHQICYYYNNMR